MARPLDPVSKVADELLLKHKLGSEPPGAVISRALVNRHNEVLLDAGACDSPADVLDQLGGLSAQNSGTFTLTAGAATVANTAVTANSVIVATVKTVGGTQGNWLKIVPTPSTGFAVTSENAADTSVYNYLILG